MKSLRSTMGLTAVLVAAIACGASGSIEIKLKVNDVDKVARSPGMITSGIPFAKGTVPDVAKLAVSAGGKRVPAQFAKTVSWEDGSVRWALLDCQVAVPAGGETELVLSDGGGNPPPASAVKVDQTADAVKVSTGPMEFVVNRKKTNWLESLKVDGKELVTSSGRGLVIRKEDGADVVTGIPSEVSVEQSGPMRATLCIRGKFPGVHNDLLACTMRLTAYAGQRFVKVHVWLENRGAHGYVPKEDQASKAEWATFDGMSIELGLGLGSRITASCEGAEADGKLKVLQLCRMTRTGQQHPTSCYAPTDLEYLVTSGTNVVARGDRTDGVVGLRGATGAMTVAVRDFWQNYEKAIELDGQTLKIWLWPLEGQWPRPNQWLTYGLFDATLEAMPRPGFYRMMGGSHKSHEVILDFSGRAPREAATELSAPLFAFAPAAHYAATEAAVGLFAPPEVRTGNRDCDFKLNSWTCMTRTSADPTGSNSLFRAKEVAGNRMYALGWMDYGDFAVPGHGPVQLHYDWPWIVLVSAMRTGDPNFLKLATPMVRHRMDVDQLWSERDTMQRCRGLMIGTAYGDYHSHRMGVPPGVADNWLAGVALYYMLTGEPNALECCRFNAESLKAAWKWVDDAKIYGGSDYDVLANAWGINSFCAMYALTADRKWLDTALGLFNAHIVPVWKREGPWLHNPENQFRSQGYAKEDIGYCYSIQMLCELHHLTGDKNLMKLLSDGCAKEYSSEGFFEAPIFFSGLFAYVGLTTGNKAYVARAADLFAQAFPESKCQPCYIPNNSTWSRVSAMYLRSGHLLQYANWKQPGSPTGK